MDLLELPDQGTRERLVRKCEGGKCEGGKCEGGKCEGGKCGRW